MDDERSTLAAAQVDSFVARFGEPYRLLATYAALPLVLTPELLNYLRSTFLHGRVPWEAEADLLLSDLVRPAGYEQFVMDQAVRAHLLRRMPEVIGADRAAHAAQVLAGYLRHLARTGALRAPEAQAQQLAAMVHMPGARDGAARELAAALASAAAATDGAGVARLASLVRALAPQLGAYPELLSYAREVARLLTGPAPADTGVAGHTSVLGVTLPPPAEALGITAAARRVTYREFRIRFERLPAIKEARPRTRFRVVATIGADKAEDRVTLPEGISGAVTVAELLAENRDLGSEAASASLDAGQQLGELIFGGEIGGLLRSTLGATPPPLLRFVLDLPGGLLESLPWELTRIGDDPPLALQGHTFIRLVHTTEPFGPRAAGPLRLLLTTNGNRDQGRLSAVEAIRDAFESLSDQASVRVHVGVSTGSLYQYAREGFDIWHFAGRAVTQEGAPMLVLRGGEGEDDPRDAQQLAGALRGTDVRLVVLDAADGESVAPMGALSRALVEQGVPAAIAPQHLMIADEATAFFLALYRSLAGRLPVDIAVADTRAPVEDIAQPPIAWTPPSLHTFVANGRLFDAAPTQEQDDEGEAERSDESSDEGAAAAGELRGALAEIAADLAASLRAAHRNALSLEERLGLIALIMELEERLAAFEQSAAKLPDSADAWQEVQDGAIELQTTAAELRSRAGPDAPWLQQVGAALDELSEAVGRGEDRRARIVAGELPGVVRPELERAEREAASAQESLAALIAALPVADMRDRLAQSGDESLLPALAASEAPARRLYELRESLGDTGVTRAAVESRRMTAAEVAAALSELADALASAGRPPAA